MKACPCLAGLVALALATVIATVPEPVSAADPVPAAPSPPAPLPRGINSPYANTAIGTVIEANDGKVPATGAELVRVLSSLGEFLQLPVAFSAVALDSGLSHPRVVLSMRPASTVQVKEWVSSGPQRVVTRPPDPLSKVATNTTQLQGRLFLAANTEIRDGKMKVRTVEFISWNSHKRAFDFGVIEGLNTDSAELKLLDGTRCFSCHKGRGPILGISPWSNTLHDNIVRATSTVAMYDALKLSAANLKSGLHTDGMSFDTPRALDMDIAVRLGGELMRDRTIFKRLAESPDTRKALVLLFDAIVTRGAIDKNDKAVQANFDSLVPARLARDARTAKLNGPSCGLRDFSPATPVARENRTFIGTDLMKNQVMLHDAARAKGQTRLPSEFVPSNPKAFAEPQVKNTQQPSEFMNAVLLAQTIGLTEPDRKFLADALDEAVKRLKNPLLTRVTVANAIFNGPAFADVLTTGILPDRDDFKDRFIAGIITVFRTQKLTDEFWAARDTYTSSPKFDPLAKPEKEVVVLPSHACLACHDVRGAGKTAFNPIPMLAFDPFDQTARDTWVKNTDRMKKAEVLGRMVKRLGTDKDMPPEDSTEAAMYRVKDPTALNAVKDWLEAELKKVK